jgi:IS605 OrfB family transposase
MTQTKARKLEALRQELRSALQFYINSLWKNPGRLDAQTLNRFAGGSLSYRHRQNSLKVALEIISSNKKAARALGTYVRKPHVMDRALSLSSLVAKIEKGKNSFDYVLKVSSLAKGDCPRHGRPIVIPFKSHKRLNYWLQQPGAKLLQGCILGNDWAGLWIKIPTPILKEEGKILGIDIGLNKLLVDSDGKQYGKEIKLIVQSIKRKQPGSKSRQRAHRHRENYINKIMKELPWDKISVLGIEDLKNLKKGKRKNRGKNFRKAIAPWTYPQVIARAQLLAQENRVRLVTVDPRNTSRHCPHCGWEAAENRKGESFSCVKCHYSNDADVVGALNVLARTFGNSQEPMVPESLCAVS